MNRERLIRILRDYPGITQVSVKPGALALEFADGTTVDMNPNLAHPIVPGETEAECVDRVLRSLAIMQHTQGMNNISGLSLANTIPLVRGADYFLSFGPAAPIALSWITDYLGFGLAIDQPGMRCVINEPLLPMDYDKYDALQLQSQAIDNLHHLAPTITTRRVGLGPGVKVITQPVGSETAWFADTRAMGQLLSELGEQSGTDGAADTWVVIPASRHQLYLVNTAVSADTWDKLLNELEFILNDHECIYPVPHTIVAGRWVEWRPEPVAPWQHRLRIVRLVAQQRINQVQAQVLQEERDQGEHTSADYNIAAYNMYMVDEKPVSLAFVPGTVPTSSIPLTDVVVFEHDGALAIVARENATREFPDLLTPQPDLHPPRFIVNPPTPAQFARLTSLGR